MAPYQMMAGMNGVFFQNFISCKIKLLDAKFLYRIYDTETNHMILLTKREMGLIMNME